ncbi:MAG: aminoacyl-tRNA hydrolase [Anaerolineales bacterium]|nr:aminoacyl-tRNA hydrolase [Anaerolineales bacterium]
MTESRFLLAGLGNPGREYRNHRHNIGFLFLDLLASREGQVFSRLQEQALVITGCISNCKVVLAKPQTFMNRSGLAVGQLMRFYKIPLENLLLIYDDLDLPLGVLRFRAMGGSGGHKGVTSVIDQVGSQEFARLRLGIGRPPGRMDPADYVLEPFTPIEEPLLEQVLEKAVSGVRTFLLEGIIAAMSKHNRNVGSEYEASE